MIFSNPLTIQFPLEYLVAVVLHYTHYACNCYWSSFPIWMIIQFLEKLVGLIVAVQTLALIFLLKNWNLTFYPAKRMKFLLQDMVLWQSLILKIQQHKETSGATIQYLELVEKMGQLMGIVERVDQEDKIPRNIQFMRVKVKIDPWLLVIASFMLRLDNGARIQIQCRYERVHKLCTRCGLIGHTRGQFTHNMEEVELMLFRQRQCIQELHQMQYRFDAVQPQFTNELRAYHN